MKRFTKDCLSGCRDRYRLLGSLLDAIKEERFDNIKSLNEKLGEYIDAQNKATEFDLKYNHTVSTSENDCHECYKVLSRNEFKELLMKGLI